MTTFHLFTGKKHNEGFSLVEVALAMAILAFASASIISLIPFGLSSFRKAMNNTVESEIVQGLVNNISMTDFEHLKSMASSQGTVYFFGADGSPVAGATDSQYKVEISFTDLSPSSSSSPLNTLTPNSGTTALITITKIDQTMDYFSVRVGNNQQVVTGASAATW